MRLSLLIASVMLMPLVGCGPSTGTVTPTVSSSPVATPSPTPSPSPEPTVLPPSPSPVPSPPPSLYIGISGSEYGSIDVQTQAGATCTARAILPNGKDAPGLRNPETADAVGHVAWTYPQSPTQTGNGSHVVSCSHNGLSATAYAVFQVGS
jgi:hypothetical protein